MDDKEIIDMYQARDENAIRQTQKKYSRYLLTIANNILNNIEDSDECVNDTYLKAWNSIPPHLPEVLSRYLAKITRGLSIDRIRKKNSRKRGGSEYELSLDELEECVPSVVNPEQSVESSLLVSLIEKFLRGCSDDARDMFVCRYYFCDSIKVIASFFGASETKVKSSLYRTRAGLKKFLEKEGYVI